MELRDRIEQGLTALSLPVANNLPERLAAYLRLIARWNRVTNLTSVKDPVDMVALHLMDSLSIHGYIPGGSVLDVASGAGLPGIPLALLNPDKDFILLDSNGKKTRFMTQVKIELGPTNVEVVQSRIEEYSGAFDHVISRAFLSTADFARLCAPLICVGGTLLAMKGPADSQAALPAGFNGRVVKLEVPGLAAERYLIELCR